MHVTFNKPSLDTAAGAAAFTTVTALTIVAALCKHRECLRSNYYILQHACGASIPAASCKDPRMDVGALVCRPAVYRHEVRTMPPQLSGGQLPLDSIFAKSQLDQLVADAWLQSEWLLA